MDISLVICTYNRAQMLSDTLASYTTLERSGDYQAELLIVDNNSNDNTRFVVEQFMAQHPEARYIFEPQPGLSHARNTGIHESHGDIIVFVDDDVIFDRRWLNEVVQIFRDYPEASCMGGKSIPQFEGGRPEWVTDDMLHMFGSTNSGDVVKWMIYPEFPYGLNMAFRSAIFEQIGLFNASLGRKKKNLLSDEEKEIFWRINKAKLQVIYTPDALLYHQIPTERIRQEWIFMRYYWQGVSDVVFGQMIAPLSRLALIRAAFQNGWQLAYRATGKNLSPRKAYWHYAATKIPERCYQAFQWGRVRRMVEEALHF